MRPNAAAAALLRAIEEAIVEFQSSEVGTVYLGRDDEEEVGETSSVPFWISFSTNYKGSPIYFHSF